jgi:hypothetical protein
VLRTFGGAYRTMVGGEHHLPISPGIMGEAARTRQTQLVNDALWPFRKRAADLDAVERARLDTLLANSPALRQAYVLREQLTTVFDHARSKADGLRRIRLWRRVVKSGLR